MKIKRVFHNWELMEEYKTNMWKMVPIETREDLQQKSRDLMIDTNAFKAACMIVVDSWPFSCEAALSASTMNHQAWIGHAACANNHGTPEDITRLAWRTLTEEQQELANNAADVAINYWKEKHIEKLKGVSNA